MARLAEKDETVAVAAVAREIELDHSAAYRRVRAALAKGYLVNAETRKGRPAKLQLGEPLPADQEILPTRDALEQRDCTLAEASGGDDTPPPLENDSDEPSPTEMDFDLGIES